jgi:predicted ATPase
LSGLWTRTPPVTAALPRLPGDYVERPQELETLRALLLRDDVRFLTLTGPPGAGKTRLAVELAASVAASFADGAHFVDLTQADDAPIVLATIASTLQVERRPDTDEALLEWLAERELLLLLDTVDQLRPAAPSLERLLAAEKLKLLVTSRVPLRVPAEQVVEVTPLAVPPASDVDVGAVARAEAVRLFVDRANAAGGTLAVDAGNAAAVAEICRRLDGLPLALELAAVWTRTLPPDRIVVRLERPLTLLTAGGSGDAPRHRTLRGAIATSYTLLDAPEQALFRSLSIFAGGCTPGDAATVSRDAAESSLESLVDRHLVRLEHGPAAEPRFGMLETIREFALERLASSGEGAEVAERHARLFLGLAERAAPELAGPGQAAWCDRLQTELANFRAALDWFARTGRHEEELRLATALRRFWFARGHLHEGRSRLRSALERGGDAPLPARAHALQALSHLARASGDTDEALAAAGELLRLARLLDDQLLVAHGLQHVGAAHVTAGDVEAAEAATKEALALFRGLGAAAEAAAATTVLAYAAHERGDYERAASLAEDALALYEEVGDAAGIAVALLNIGLARLEAGRPAEAAELFSRALVIARESANREYVAYALEGLSAVHAERRPEHAARLLGGAAAIRQAAGSRRDPVEEELHERTVATIREHLGDDRLEASLAAGAGIDWERLPG